MNPATTIAETTEAARRMVGRWLTMVRHRLLMADPERSDAPVYAVCKDEIVAALAQAMVDADLTPEQVERIEATVQRFFE